MGVHEAGGTQKKRTCRMPLALGSGAAPSARHSHRGRSWVHLGEPQSCAPSVPISVLKFHGTADPECRWWAWRRDSGYGRKSSLRLPRSSRDSHALGRVQLSSRLQPLLHLQALIALEAAPPSCGPAATSAGPPLAWGAAGRPQARAPAGAGWKGVGGRRIGILTHFSPRATGSPPTAAPPAGPRWTQQTQQAGRRPAPQGTDRTGAGDRQPARRRDGDC
jgi:hypothetical protein